MDNDIIRVFDNPEFGHLRVTTDNSGEPWFVAKDVCDALGIQTNHVREILDDDEVSNLPTTEVGPELGGRDPLIVSEAGMYALVLKSRKPEAHAFKRWVTHDVLPSIRRHGAYATPQTLEAMLADPDTMIATLTALKAERQRSARLAEDNAELAPKAMVYDLAMAADGTMSVTEAARYLHQHDRAMTRTRLIALLRADGKLCRDSLAPTREALDRGYMVQMLTTRGDGTANRPYAHVTRKGLGWCIRRYCASTEVA